MPNTTNGTISEVIVGTGVLYVAAIANEGNSSGDYVAFPGGDGAGAWASPAAGWVDVGYSEDGWTLEMDKTFEDIMVAEEIDPIATFKTAQEVRLTGELAQASQANIQVALGGGTLTTGDGSNGFESGFNMIQPPSTDDFDEKSLLLIVDGPAGADRHVQIPRAINVGAFSMAHQKAPQKVVIATEFKVLAPKGTVSQFQELFRIVDNTNDTQVFDIN
tara:strand:+ start:543 stop:1196 length:654 start_codon:yes stop_codon:yes gene_type:complete